MSWPLRRETGGAIYTNFVLRDSAPNVAHFFKHSCTNVVFKDYVVPTANGQYIQHSGIVLPYDVYQYWLMYLGGFGTTRGNFMSVCPAADNIETLINNQTQTITQMLGN